MTAKNFIVFGRDTCHFCTKAKNLLEENAIDYDYVNVDDDHNLAVLKEMLPGVSSIPQIFVNGDHIGGYDQLKEFIG